MVIADCDHGMDEGKPRLRGREAEAGTSGVGRMLVTDKHEVGGASR